MITQSIADSIPEVLAKLSEMQAALQKIWSAVDHLDPDPIQKPKLLTLKEVAERLRLSKRKGVRTARGLIKAGQLIGIEVPGTKVVLVAELDFRKFVDECRTVDYWLGGKRKPGPKERRLVQRADAMRDNKSTDSR